MTRAMPRGWEGDIPDAGAGCGRDDSFMTTHLQMHRRLAGAIVGGWLTLEVSLISRFVYLFLAVPLIAALGATSYGQRLTRPALALTGGVMAGQFVSAITAALPAPTAVLSLVVLVGVTAIFWSVLPAGRGAESLPIVFVPAKRASR